MACCALGCALGCALPGLNEKWSVMGRLAWQNRDGWPRHPATHMNSFVYGTPFHHFGTISQLHATPYALCDMLYLVPVLIGC